MEIEKRVWVKVELVDIHKLLIVRWKCLIVTIQLVWVTIHFRVACIQLQIPLVRDDDDERAWAQGRRVRSGGEVTFLWSYGEYLVDDLITIYTPSLTLDWSMQLTFIRCSFCINLFRLLSQHTAQQLDESEPKCIKWVGNHRSSLCMFSTLFS